MYESIGGDDDFVDVENSAPRPGVNRTAMTIDGRDGGGHPEEERGGRGAEEGLMGINASPSVGIVVRDKRVYSGIIACEREVI